MIEICNLSKSYGKKEVLIQVNATFNEGEIYGIVGQNGAGKTTFFQSILGFEDYTGKVNYSGGILKNVVGYLPTNPEFISKLTGKEYLQLMCNARGIKMASFTSKNIFDLPLHQYAETYSTGMKKKLALTAILLQKNEVFVLDEPFNGVDVHSNILIIEIIKQLKDRNKIVLLSSHIFSTLTELCDTLFYLDNGILEPGLGKEHFTQIEDKLKGEKEKINWEQLDF